MENSTLSKRSIAFGLALAITCIVNAIIVVVKERNETVMSGMKKILGHHWTTHSAIVILLFLLLGVALALPKGVAAIRAGRVIGVLVSSVVVAGLIILGFYCFAD